MKLFFILCFVSFFLVHETCSQTKQRLQEFQKRLQEISAPTPTQPPAASPPASSSKMKGRVLYPIGYGADPTGTQESSDAILEALSDAFQLQSEFQLLPGVNDLGGVVIDLQGGNYKIGKPIRFPASGGANVVVQGGTLRASDTFPGDRHLVELVSPNSQPLEKSSSVHGDHHFGDQKDRNDGIYYEDITFRDILFDSSYRGGGLFIIDSARIRITNCFFLRFTTEGVLVQKGHETFLSGCFLGQHPTIGGDKGERDYSGTAIDIAGNDNAITDVVIFSAAIGILLRGQANIVTGAHCYNKATYFGGIGILVKLTAGSSLTRIANCYLDYTGVVMEDPVQVHVTNTLFLGDANVIFKSIHGKISGVNIVDNMFNGSPNNMVPIIKLDGEFDTIDQVVVERNNAVGMRLKSTAAKLTVVGNGTRWVADFSPVLVFPDRINHFQYSFSVQGLFFPVVHAVTNVSGNIVVVESDREVNGAVSVAVDQYDAAGGSNFAL